MRVRLSRSLISTVGPLCIAAFAQTDGGWTAQRLPPGTPADLRAVAVVDASTVIVVGASGTILRSTDGGGSWRRDASFTSATLTAISFADARTGTVVGLGGTILRTEDGGATWMPQSSGTTSDLCDVAFRDALTGVAVGAVPSCDGMAGGGVGAQTGFAVRTTDGGVNWTLQRLESLRLWSVSFPDANTLVATGDRGIILRSDDAGATWIYLSQGNNVNIAGGLRAVFFHDSNSGVVAGGGTQIYLTRDGGVTWTRTLFLSGAPLFGTHFANARAGVAVGTAGILKTLDGGATWTQQVAGRTTYRGVYLSSPISGWVVGDGALLRTSTGGAAGPIAVSAASLMAPVAPGSLVSIVGSGLASSTEEADRRSPSTSLGGIRLRVRDSGGENRLARLLYVSPHQINFELPSETALGAITLEIDGSANVRTIPVRVQSTAPGLFEQDDGTAAGYAVRIEPDGRQTVLPPGAEIVLDARPVYLSLFGTGFRNRVSLEDLEAAAGSVPLPVTYAGPSGDAAPGLDQVNLLLSPALKGMGDQRLVLTVDGVASNSVRVRVR